MEVLFYLFSVISVIATLGVILSVYPVYALLYLIISLLSIACIFFILGAYLAGALEVIIYAGAIVVLFVFVVMLLNIDFSIVSDSSLIVRYNFRNVFLLFMFLTIFLYCIWDGNSDHFKSASDRGEITLKDVGVSLFTSYIFLVEMASMLLLGALLISFHIGRSSKNNIKK